MRSRCAELFVIDILIAADAIARHMRGVNDAVSFVADELLFTAVTRECEILGEATNNVLRVGSFAQLVSPQWRRVVDFRNLISHEYFGLNFEDIFEIVKKDLPSFVEEVLVLANGIKHTDDFKLALAGAKNDLSRIGRKKSVEYLVRLENTLYGT